MTTDPKPLDLERWSRRTVWQHCCRCGRKVPREDTPFTVWPLFIVCDTCRQVESLRHDD